MRKMSQKNLTQSEKLDQICDDLRMIKECLYGDGNPGRGLTDRLSVLENQLKWIMRLGFGIIAVLLAMLGVKEIPKLF